MIRTLLLTSAMIFATVSSSQAAEPLEGTWKRPNGTILQFANAGGTKFCGTVMTGKYKGKSIGCMSGTNGKYNGEIIKLDEGKTYKGKASVSGNTLRLAGCVAGGLICKSESLARN